MFLLLFPPAWAKGAYIQNNFPGFLFVDGIRNHRGHVGVRATVFNDPKELTIRSLLVKLAIREITRPWTDHLGGGTIAFPSPPMAVNANPFAFIQVFPI